MMMKSENDTKKELRDSRRRLELDWKSIGLRLVGGRLPHDSYPLTMGDAGMLSVLEGSRLSQCAKILVVGLILSWS